MFNREDMMDAFLDEVEEQLQLLDQQILLLERDGEHPERIQTIFRVAHTLKGSSAAMGFEEMAGVTHEMESVFDMIRQGKLTVTDAVVNVLFECLDHLRKLKVEFSAGALRTDVGPLVAQLKHVLQHGTLPDDEPEMRGAGTAGSSPERKRQTIRCEVELENGCTMRWARAHVILCRLQQLGDVIHTVPKLNEEPEDEECLAKITYVLHTEELARHIEEELRGTSDVAGVHLALVAEAEAESYGDMPLKPASEKPRDGAGSSETVKSPLAKTVRVDVERIEKLMDLVGELVIDQTRIAMVGDLLRQKYDTESEIEELQQISSHIAQVVGELQESVMKARMLPVEQLFNRFPRMVRDLARSLGKEVDFIMEGRETELDRTVVEEIGDPLIHLLRNALDHGIEDADTRERAGKPRKGTLRVKAAHEENQVVLTVEEDGAGIDPDKIKQSAIRKKLITEQQAEAMPPNDLIQLIFEAGFSTAQTVSDVSGRGVGMDIVRNHIEKLNGLIDVDTKLGEGTRFTIKLPLTLAILNGLLIRLNGRTFALPMGSVVEIVRKPVTEIHSLTGQPVIIIRDKAIPLVWLHDWFGFSRSAAERKHAHIIIVGVAEKRFGLVVDELIGNQEIVVKSVGSYIGKVEGVSGATILGNGNVALILDAIGISKMVQGRRSI